MCSSIQLEVEKVIADIEHETEVVKNKRTGKQCGGARFYSAGSQSRHCSANYKNVCGDGRGGLVLVQEDVSNRVVFRAL